MSCSSLGKRELFDDSIKAGMSKTMSVPIAHVDDTMHVSVQSLPVPIIMHSFHNIIAVQAKVLLHI